MDFTNDFDLFQNSLFDEEKLEGNQLQKTDLKNTSGEEAKKTNSNPNAKLADDEEIEEIDDFGEGGEAVLSEEIAMDEQGSEITQKENVEQLVLTGLPVDVFFKYGQASEKLGKEEIAKTFDEFRKSKISDFPEFEKGDKVVWTVNYLVLREVKDPAKTTIEGIKSEIEASAEYASLLKKNKKPLCMEIKPRVSGQSKGVIS